jgi:hypothetical protein
MRDVARTMGCNFLESKSGRATACQGFSSDSAEFLFWSKLARTLARSSSHALLCSPNEQYYYYWSKHGSLLNSFWHFLMSVSQCNWRINQKKAQMIFFLPSLLPSLPPSFLPCYWHVIFTKIGRENVERIHQNRWKTTGIHRRRCCSFSRSNPS